MASENIDIRIREDGARVVRRSIEDVGNAGERAASGIDLLKRALIGIGAAAAVRELIRMADVYTNLQNRLRLVTTGTQNLGRVTDELFAISNRTRSSFEGTAELYARIALAAKDLGTGQQELLNFTESLNQAIILSGASAVEAQAGLIQLSQGLASGTLRGDELRSVLEQLPAVADVIAKGLGVTRGELRKMGEDGKITAKVVLDAFKLARGEIAEKFASTVPTAGQSLTVLKNKALELWGSFSTGSGIMLALSSGLLAVANNLDNIVPLIVGVGAAFAAWQVSSIIRAVIAPMIALEFALGETSVLMAVFSAATKLAQGAVNGFTLALLANPFTAVLVGVTALIALFAAFGDDIKVTSDGVVSLKDATTAAMQLILESVSDVTRFFGQAWNSAVFLANGVLELFGTTFSGMLTGILSLAKLAVNSYIALWLVSYDTIRNVWSNFPGAMNTLFVSVVNLGATAAEKLLNVWQAPLRLIAAGLSAIGNEAGDSLTAMLDGFTLDIPRMKGSDAGSQFAEAFKQSAKDRFNTDYLGNFTDAVLERARANIKASEKGGTAALQPGTGGGAGAAGDNGAAKRLAAAFGGLLGVIDPVREATENLARDTDILNAAQKAGLVSASQYGVYMDRLRASYAAAIDPLGAMNAELVAQHKLALLTGPQMEIERELRDRILELQQRGVTLTPLETQALRDKLVELQRTNDAMREQDQLLQTSVLARQQLADRNAGVNKLLNDPASGFTKNDAFNAMSQGMPNDLFQGSNEAIQAQLQPIREMYAQIEAMRQANVISEQTAAQAIARLSANETQVRLQNYSTYFGDLASLSLSGNKRIAAIGKAAAVAQATIDGVAAVQKALASAPPPFNYALAAAVGIQAASNVSRIMSTAPGFMTGGSFMVGGSGGADSQMVAFRASPGERVSINTPTQVRKGTNGADGGGDVNITIDARGATDPQGVARAVLTSLQSSRNYTDQRIGQLARVKLAKSPGS